MSLKKTLTDLSFKRDEEGRTIVYFYSGKGYVVPDGETEEKLRTVRLWLIIATFLPVIIGIPSVILSYGQIYEWPLKAWFIMVAMLAVLDVGQRAVVRIVTREMTPAAPMGYVEALQTLRNAAPRLWRWYMWSLVVVAPYIFLVSVVYLAAGTWIMGYVLPPSTWGTVASIVGVVSSAFMMLGGIYGLRSRPQS